MKNLPSLKKIHLYKKDVNYVKETVKQIGKDFQLAGIPVQILVNDGSYDTLFQQVSTLVEELYKENPEKLRPLYYQIDLKEEDLAQDIDLPIQEHVLQITEMIIERELLKVVLRHYYIQ